MRRSERRRVVEAVADHCRLAAFTGDVVQPFNLIGRKYAAPIAFDTRSLRHGFRGAVMVAGQQLDVVALTFQPAHRVDGAGAQCFDEAEPGDLKPVARQNRSDSRARRFARGRQSPCGPAQPPQRSPEPSLHALARNLPKIGDHPGRGQSVGVEPCDSLREGVAGMAGQRHRDGDGLFIRVAVGPRLRNAGGQRAGLVEDDRVDLGQAFHRRSVLDHDPVLEQAPRGDDLDDGNGQTQRAGAGDDQHRDRDRDRPMPVARRRHPAEEGEQGGDVDDR